MSFFRYIALLSAVVCMLQSGCSLPTGGAGGETTNGLITGSVRNNDGSKVAAAEVRLFPSDYDPVKNNAKVPTLITDSLGNYSFFSVAPGEYAVEATNGTGGIHALAVGIHVSEDTVTAPLCTFGVPGAISIELTSGSDGSAGYLYIPGTDLFSFLSDTTDSAVIDSVPAGIMPAVCYASTIDTTSVVIRYDVAVSSGVTTTIQNPLWNYARQLVLNTTPDGADVSGNVMNFPVLIRLTAADFDFSQVREGGADLRFMKADATALPYAIEVWDAAAGLAEVWVLVDTVRGNDSLQSIFMYWGNAAASPESDAAAVFSTQAGFQGVWHFSETGVATIHDATENHYDGIAENMSAASVVPGLIGTARNFDGTSTCIHMPGTAGSTLNFPEHGTYSVSAWVNIDSLTGEYRMIASKGDKQYNLQFRGETQNWQFTEYQDTVGWDQTVAGAVAGEWVYLVGVRENDKQYLYLNGVCADSGIYNHSHFPSDTTYAEQQGYRDTTCDFMIGKKVDFDAWYFNGVIDEVRVEDRAAGPDWIKLCYMNQKSTDMLVQFHN